MKDDELRNILIFTLEFVPFIGGVANYNYELAKGLAALGYKVEVLTCHYPLLGDEEAVIDEELLRNHNVKVIRKEKKRRASLIPWIIMVNKFIKEANHAIDYMLITDIGSQRVAPSINFKKANIKYFITFHGSDILTIFIKKHTSKGIMKIGFPLFRQRAELLCSRANGIIFVSQFAKKLFSKYSKCEINSSCVIYNGIGLQILKDGNDLKKKSGGEVGCCNLITISRLDPRKNHESVIRAIASMPLEVKKRIVYNIVGQGSEEGYLRNLVADLELNDIVYFFGQVTAERKMDLLDMADIFIMPSREWEGTVEGLGISFLEAGGRGLPLVGGKHGGVSEVITDGVNGFLVNPESLFDIRCAILKLFSDTELRERMGMNSLRVIKRKFVADKMVADVVDFIKKTNNKYS